MFWCSVFKISAGPRTLNGETWVRPAIFPSLPYINFGKIVHWSGKFQMLFWRLDVTFILLLMWLKYSERTRTTPQLLPWLFALPWHQQPRYWMWEIGTSFHEEGFQLPVQSQFWEIMEDAKQIYFQVFLEKISTTTVGWKGPDQGCLPYSRTNRFLSF